ncbi:MAG TPA: SRPBCC family protein [Capsulimonadaceae bacterium]|nr:SRPBCC family protein [Capsulimonadaceae bacterium]
MPEASAEVTINRPIDTVFAFIADGRNNKAWRPAVVSILQETEGAPRVGTIYRQKMQGPGGRPVSADYQIVVLEPNKRMQFKVIAGPVRPEGEYRFESTPGGPKVLFHLSCKPTGFAKLLTPMVSKQLPIEVASLANLKKALEAHE